MRQIPHSPFFERSIFCSFLFLIAVACTEQHKQPNQATISINTDVQAINYNPMIFGGFLEHFGRQIYGGIYDPGSPLSDDNGFRKDVILALKELKIPVIRWPGGCFVSGYHWERGVGMDRTPTDDMAWGVREPNTFGTDEFVRFCSLVGCEPYICTNAGNGTVEEMCNWVQYTNGTSGDYSQLRIENGSIEPLDVRIWSIGNENYGAWEIGHKPKEQWAQFVLKAAEAMKKVDPQIQLSAASNEDYAPHLLDMAGPYLDYISIHGYPLGRLHEKNEMPDYLSCIIKSENPEKRINSFISILENSGYRGQIKIAFDEWNLRGWHHPGFPRKSVQDYSDPEVKKLVKARENNSIASQYTMADALFSASFLNTCLRHSEDVEMANIAPIVNTRGPLYIHPDGIVRRTHFHTLSMYVNQLEEQVCKTEVTADGLACKKDTISVVDAIATVDRKGENWAIAMINRHPSEKVSCTVKLGDKLLDGVYKASLLTGDSPDSYNDISHPNRVITKKVEIAFSNGVTDLSPHSLLIVHVPVK